MSWSELLDHTEETTHPAGNYHAGSGSGGGCIRVLEGNCCWISREGVGHPRCIYKCPRAADQICVNKRVQQGWS